MLDEKKFRRIILGITIAVVVLVVGGYFTYFTRQPVLDDKDIKTAEVVEKVPINPFDAFSMLKEDLMLKFGEGEQGSGIDYDNQYVDYKQEWFGQEFKARYYYGLYDRVYQINLKLDKNTMKEVYDEMTKQLGTPIVDVFYDKSKLPEDSISYWIKDAVNYAILYDEGVPMVKMRLQYYANPDGHNLGDRPTIIQRKDEVEGIIKGEKVSVLLVGDKPEYTSRYYKNLYVVLGTREGSYVGRMKKDSDGGYYPRFDIKKINSSSSPAIVVETDNEYTKWYTGFEFKEGQLNIIYSEEKEPSM